MAQRASPAHPCALLLLLTCLSCAGVSVVSAQKVAARPQKLPSPDKIIDGHLKVVGGKKAQGAIRDAVYDWRVVAEGGTTVPSEAEARARVSEKVPAATRADIFLSGGEINTAANARSAWARGLDGKLRTLTDAEAGAAKLQAALDAGRLINYKKLDVLARTVEVGEVAGEPAYVVDFARRDGARVRYWFSLATKFLVQSRDEVRGLTVRYSDYRRVSTGGAMLEPHRLEMLVDDAPSLTLALKRVRYNTGLSDALFEPPGEQSLDVPALLREVGGNQRQVDERISEYTYTRRDIGREINDRGELKKETTAVYEIYPAPGGGRVLKLVSENNLPLTPERLAKEERRVGEELEKLERENEKRRRKGEEAKLRNETGAGEDGDDDIGITTFLRACEFVAPRRERFREREVIVFDFRPRPGFKPSNRAESIGSKLSGVVWIDPTDKQVMRLEARLDQSFKIGGGLLASIKPGSAFVFEQTRLPDGVWLPRFAQINAAAKVFLFAGFRLDATREYSDYKRFSATSDDGKIDAPVKQ